MIKFVLWDFYNVLYFPRTDQLNNELIEFIEDHNKKYGFGVLTAVNSDITNWLQERKIKRYFEFIKNTTELGLPKTDPGLYETVVNSLGFKPNQVLMVDDLSENLEAANDAGLLTLKYRKTVPFRKQLNEANIKL
jgi:HAD superfamily hydrolase (TIGR01509 family)